MIAARLIAGSSRMDDATGDASFDLRKPSRTDASLIPFKR
jgi:hypothetical protein